MKNPKDHKNINKMEVILAKNKWGKEQTLAYKIHWDYLQMEEERNGINQWNY